MNNPIGHDDTNLDFADETTKIVLGQLAAVTAERDALAKSLCYLIGEHWPDADGDTESEKAMSVVIDKQAAELSELRARMGRWRALARNAIEEFDDARGYAGDYFTEKWGYDETSADFHSRFAVLEGVRR